MDHNWDSTQSRRPIRDARRRKCVGNEQLGIDRPREEKKLSTSTAEAQQQVGNF